MRASSGTSMRMNLWMLMPASTREVVCLADLGNPSSKHPFAMTSDSCIRVITRFVIKSSGTNNPWSMYSLAFLPKAVPRFTWSRKMSPVERCTRPNWATIFSHCVPLPAAGGPAMHTTFSGGEETEMGAGAVSMGAGADSRAGHTPPLAPRNTKISSKTSSGFLVPSTKHWSADFKLPRTPSTWLWYCPKRVRIFSSWSSERCTKRPRTCSGGGSNFRW
mmetsp:Transcript_1841/g.2452  ORF Transcript_1841/g.2452 Transcript_1841/m.2452 type:complete len:219 (+) Transcript_1841:428-1084(+)